MRVVKMQVGEENEGGFVIRRLFGGDEVGLCKSIHASEVSAVSM